MKRILIISIICISASMIYATYRFVGLTPSSKSDLTIVGIDISHWNSVYDWSKVEQNSDFCIIKATEGAKCRDSKFKSYWNSCKRIKMAKGAYHFFKPGVPAVDQFNNFKRTVKLSTGDFPPILDVELKEANMAEVRKWLELAEAHYGVTPIVYTEYAFFKVFIEGNIDTKYPLWIYVDQKFNVKPSFADHNCIMWQYSHTGKVDGIAGQVDLDAVTCDSQSLSEVLIK